MLFPGPETGFRESILWIAIRPLRVIVLNHQEQRVLEHMYNVRLQRYGSALAAVRKGRVVAVPTVSLSDAGLQCLFARVFPSRTRT